MLSDIFCTTKLGIEFSVHLVPGAKEEKVIGIVDTTRGKEIKIAIHEKPTENRANIALIKFLSEILRIPKSQISIKRGHKSREKRIEIINVLVADIAELVNGYM